MASKVLVVIPARYESTRFPGKPLVLISGVSLIERVHRLCAKVRGVDRVVVATDDRRIERHVRNFGGEVMMTRKNHPSGTDRVAEVAKRHHCEIVINVQGDEPLLDPRVIQSLAAMMRKNSTTQMATLAHPLQKEKDWKDPNVVKVVMDKNGHALYFSRATIPCFREQKQSMAGLKRGDALRHIGIYAYRRNFLLRYVQWPQSSLEKIEKLEQLRALEHGVAIQVLKTHYPAVGVDVPRDVALVEKLLRHRHG